ncbi:MAG: TonB-dependent receptor [Mangrovibacterium sp.]
MKIVIKREQRPNLFEALSSVSNLRDAKKNLVYPSGRISIFFLKKNLLKMKLTFLCLLLSFTQLLASKGFSQSTARLTLNLENVRLEEVLLRIEEQSNLYFIYNREVVDVNRKVDVSYNNQDIEKVLYSLFHETGVEYEIRGSHIILKSSSDQIRQQKISGKVTDSGGQPLPGVTVVVKGAEQYGTITNSEGSFTLDNVPSNGVLTFSFIGMKSQEIEVEGKTFFSVILREEVIGIEEVVAIGYGTQKKTSLVASVASMDGSKIVAAPVSDVTNGIGGRLSGVIVRQVSGQPGNDGSSIYIRGISTTGSKTPLVIVDGVPRSFNELDPNSIKSVSVLKDAAAVAPYGVAGANGVVLVTTKRGDIGKPTIRYNGYYGVQNPTFLPDFVNLEQMAQLRNQIAINANQPIPWTEERLKLHLDGTDPDRYPNFDVLSTVIRKNSPITNHNIEGFGGNESFKYYTSLGFQRQDGMWDTDYENRYTMVVNLDAKVTKTTSVSLNINGRVNQHIEPAIGERVGQGAEYIMQLLSYAFPDQPLYFSNGLHGTYVSAAIDASGKKTSDVTAIYTQFSLEQALPVIPGLSFKGTIAYDPSFYFIKAWQLPTHIYTLDTSTNPYTYKDGIWGPSTASLTETVQKYNQLTFQGSLNYSRLFGKNSITALALFETKENNYHGITAGRRNYSISIDELSMGSSAAADISNSGTSTLARQIGVVYRLSYEFDSKYLFETSGRYDGHYYFAPGNRWGFFPSFAVGWRLSEENFIKQNFSWLDNLKVRASYGEVGALAGSGFQYLSMYSAYGPAYAFDGSAVIAASERAEANKTITWERAKKRDIGLEAGMWQGLLNLEIDYFYEKRSNMLVSPNVVVPSEYGIGLSQVNEGVMKNEGIDLTFGSTYKHSKDLQISINGTFTFARNKLLQIFETSSTYDNPNRRLTGKPLGVIFGYKALGYFKTEDFDESGNLKPGIAIQPWGEVQPGDLRYEDIVEDGKINENDITQIGKSSIPEIVYGISPGIQYKKFSLNLLFQGAGNANFRLHGAGAWPFWGNRQAYVSHLDNWTPENTDARYPRLVAGQTTNNQQASSWWVENTSYLRLKTATLSYDIPVSVTQKIGIQNARITFSGQNLYTWTSVINFDPEMNNTQSWDYPQQTVYSIGATITF